MKKVLLYSGGMDSWLIDKIWKPDIKLFFHIHTKSNEIEFERVKGIKDVEVVEMDLARFEQVENNYFMPLRNLHFLIYAAHYGNVLCIGSIGGSVHKDNDENFKYMTENVINYLLSEKPGYESVQIEMPFVNKSKTNLLSEYMRLGGDIEEAYRETFSCYEPQGNKECHFCTSCLSKFTAFYNNGYNFSKEDIKVFLDSVEKQKPRCEHDVIDLYNLLRGEIQ